MKRPLLSLLGLLCTHICCVRGMQVEQSPPVLSLQEGASCTLRCNFSTSANNVQWFRQNPEGRLINLFYIPSGTKRSGRLNATTVVKERYTALHISSSQTTDSATYLCAVVFGGGQGRLTFGKGTKLSVKPNIRDPAPAVYQLKSSKSNNTICLFTDFDSRSNESTNLLKSDTETFQSDQTTLDMRSMDSKSNGILFWKSRPDFACDNISDKSLFHSSSGIVCDAKLVEKSFETDMHLNFKNLSVIGFRILLLKVAGFNLLMTLRLWSR